MEFNAVCFDMKKTPSCDQEGPQLEVTQHPHSLRHVANIIVALQRMKHSHTPRGTEFSDNELLNIMLENVIEERVTPIMLDDVARRPCCMFNKTGVVPYSVCDCDQKSFVLRQAPLELQAVILQGGNMDLKVNLNLSNYVSRGFADSERRPVALGIAGSAEVDAEMLRSIDARGEMARFLFLKREEGFATTTLESLKFRDWFISTSVEDKRTVEMCKAEAPARLTAFSVKQL